MRPKVGRRKIFLGKESLFIGGCSFYFPLSDPKLGRFLFIVLGFLILDSFSDGPYLY
jgi:hypothetical protein